MELDLLEGLALGESREKALSSLLEGTPEHDYWSAVHLQHQGKLDEVDALLNAWRERHQHNWQAEQMRSRIARRQVLLRAGKDLAGSGKALQYETGVSLSDQAESAIAAVHYPSRLDQERLTLDALIDASIARTPDLSQLTEFAHARLVARAAELNKQQRASLAGLLQSARYEGALDLLAEDLEKRGVRTFGQRKAHASLTTEQLEKLAERLPELRNEAAWVRAVLARMSPPPHVDVTRDLAARRAWLDALWAFLEPLAPSFTWLKALVRNHQLELDRREGVYDRARFVAYLAIPRSAGYVSQRWIEKLTTEVRNAAFTEDRAALALAAYGNDEPLVRAYLEHFLSGPNETAADFAPYLDSRWLNAVTAEARLLAGVGDVRKWTEELGAEATARIRDRVEIEFTKRNTEYFSERAAVSVEVDVKNVAELTVKVFRVDALAYFLATGSEVDATLDLDGMVAGAERVVSAAAPSMRRVRTQIALPECAEPGTYVVELIGNGRSSRALVRKGALSATYRTTPDGTVLRVFDEAGQRARDARLFLDRREYAPDARGEIVVPFGTNTANARGMLVRGAVTQLFEFLREVEQYALHLGVLFDRASLVAGTTATAVLTPSLRLAGRRAPLSLLENPRAELQLTDGDGTVSTRAYPLALKGDEDATVSFHVPANATRVVLRLDASVRLSSTQRVQELSAQVETEVNQANATLHTEGLHLAFTRDGYVLNDLGRTGEPLAGRVVRVELWARATSMSSVQHGDYRVEATLETDARGRIELGPLHDVLALSATGPNGETLRWFTAEPFAMPALVTAHEGEPIELPALPESGRRALSDCVSLHAIVTGPGGWVPVRDETHRVSLRDGAYALEGLSAGLYQLVLRGTERKTLVTILPAEAPSDEGYTLGATEVYQLTSPVPFVRAVSVEAEHVTLRIAEVGPRTRVHVFATRFAPDPLAGSGAGAGYTEPNRPRGFNDTRYLSNRDLGDEYRYVLDRKRLPRRPGVLLDKPGMLLHPWAVRTTNTATESLSMGSGYADRGGMRANAPAPRPSVQGSAKAVRPPSTGNAPSLDFLRHPASVLANLRPDADGVVRIARSALPGAGSLRVVLADPRLDSEVRVALEEQAPTARDLRLSRALDPAQPVHEDRRVEGHPAGAVLVVEDTRSGRLEVVDSLARAHQILLSLGAAETLREFSFVTQWASLDERNKRAKYTQYACHELHIFLWARDPEFFARVVKPYLANKRARTFVDRFLLDEDLSSYARPHAFARLNALEQALLAHRVPSLRKAVARWLDDAVNAQAPDPQRDARLVDALLGAATLEGGGFGAAAAGAPAEMDLLADEDESPKMAEEAYASSELRSMSFGGGGAGYSAGMVPPPPPPPPAEPEPVKAKKTAERSRRARSDDGDDDGIALQRDRRESNAPVFRPADKTSEWAETHWYRLRLAASTSALVAPNRFLRDLALHDPASGPFLSPYLGDCADSFPTAMSALALLALPFTAAKHDVSIDETRMALTLGSNALVARTRIAATSTDDEAEPVLVGQSYFDANDRWLYEHGVHREKPASMPLRAGVAYVCKVVVTNPTGASRTLSVLRQLPQGAIALQRGFVTATAHVELGPYATWTNEYAFYFPRAGSYTHLPAQVTRNGKVLARTASLDGGRLTVSSDPPRENSGTWAHISQHGTLDEVLAYLDTANLALTNLGKIAWRMREKGAFERVTAKLTESLRFDARIWAYALAHGDVERTREWLAQHDSFLRDAGGALEGAPTPVDPEALHMYEHLEYAPLINARAHPIGSQRTVLNEGLAAQYAKFLDYVAHKPRPSDDDLLSAAHYLFTMDRTDDALRAFDRADPAKTVAKLQYAYLSAYAALCRGDLEGARRLAAPHIEHPVDRWRTRFTALFAALDAAEGRAAVEVFDRENRDQTMQAAASREPTLEVTVKGAQLTLQHRNLATCELRFYRMDLELLFSRSPFVQGDVRRFGWIAPGHTLAVALDGSGTTVVELPEGLRSVNAVVEAVAPGVRASVVHYAHDLAVELAGNFGQVRVLRASSKRPERATYVKAYARYNDGTVSFFKDGYTDVGGRFDYASVSTDGIERVQRFALLVVSDEAGATVLEAAPPAR